MICPKCQHAMRTFDRNGIHLEQCENCRGIYLDNGELEQILLADRAQFQQAAVPQQAPPPYQPGPMSAPQHAPQHAPQPYAAAAMPGHAAAAPPPQSHKKKDDFWDDDDDDDFFGKSKDAPGKKKKKDRWGFLEELFD